MSVTVHSRSCAVECGQDGLNDARPVVDDHRVVEAQSLESEGRCRGIPIEIAMATFGARVVDATVDFQDQATADDEVDATDPVDRDLAFEVYTDQMQSQAKQRLQSALRVGSGEIEQPVSCRRKLPPYPCASRAESKRLFHADS